VINEENEDKIQLIETIIQIKKKTKSIDIIELKLKEPKEEVIIIEKSFVFDENLIPKKT